LLVVGLWLVPGRSAVAALPAWQLAPVVPTFGKTAKRHLVAAVDRGERRGMRGGVFAKAGDSNTEMSAVLYGLGCRKPRYGRLRFLAWTVRRYNRVKLPNPLGFPDCQPSTSFSRHSAATRFGTWSAWSSTRNSEIPPGFAPPDFCRPTETPITCELRITRPRYLFLMAGTNDVVLDQYFGVVPGSEIGERLRPAIRQARSRGVIPVLSTVPPLLPSEPEWTTIAADAIARTNAGIFRLARSTKVPMINLWRALTAPTTVGQGMSIDGTHLAVCGFADQKTTLDPSPAIFGASVDFRPAALKFGANRRNLITLLTLARMDRITG
jgi:hypothetical protein